MRFPSLALILLAVSASSGWLHAGTITIMPFGDSITEGYKDNPGGFGGYRGPLGKDLSAAGVDFKFVGASTENSGSLPAFEQRHNGYGGYMIATMLKNLDPDSIFNSDHTGATTPGGKWMNNADGPVNPDIILLMAGTNELLKGRDRHGVADMPFQARMDEIESRMTKLLDWFKNNQGNAQVYVASLPPIFYEFKDGHDVSVEAYNDWLKTYVPKVGPNFHSVDMYSIFVTDGSLNKDHFIPNDVHPNHAGYVAIADAWNAAIADSLKK